jgi:hypothetical protein
LYYDIYHNFLGTCPGSFVTQRCIEKNIEIVSERKSSNLRKGNILRKRNLLFEKDAITKMVKGYPEKAISSEQIYGTDFEILFLHRFFSPKAGVKPVII